jgi:hypothetical protein
LKAKKYLQQFTGEDASRIPTEAHLHELTA